MSPSVLPEEVVFASYLEGPEVNKVGVEPVGAVKSTVVAFNSGLCPIGGGYFYISHQDGGPGGKLQSSTVHLYQWTGDSKEPFRLVE